LKNRRRRDKKEKNKESEKVKKWGKEERKKID
jgi:hypothetical protein